MIKETLFSIFKNKYFQIFIIFYLIIRILLIIEKYFNADFGLNDDLLISHYALSAIAFLFLLLFCLKSILELTNVDNLPKRSLMNMFGHLAIFTVPNWFIFLGYSSILMMLIGIGPDQNNYNQSPLKVSVYMTGVMAYFVLYLAGGAIIIGSRSMEGYFRNLKIMLSNRQSYLYLLILFIPYILSMISLIFNFQNIREFDYLMILIGPLIIYFDLIFLVMHWQRIKSIA